MRAPFSPVTSGQPLQFSATEYNAFIRAALRKERGINRNANPPDFGRHVGATVQVQNISDPAVDFDPGDVVRLIDEQRDSTLTAPINSGNRLLERFFTADVPNSTDPLNAVYAICLERIPGEYTRTVVSPDDTTIPGGVGHAIVDEIAIATVDVKDVEHKYARPNGKTLDSTTDPMSPYILIGTPPSVDVVDMHVWQRGISTVVRQGVATTAITAGGSGIVTILYDGSAEQWLGVDHTVTAYLDWLGEDISQGLKVFICYFPEDNKWRVIAAECEPEPALAPPGHGDFIEASTTQTQAAATSMSYAVNRITVCDNDYDSVKMPDRELEDQVIVQNDTDNILRVWPNTDERFTHQGNNAHYDIGARTTEEFWALRPDKWMPETGFDGSGRTFDGTDDYINLGAGSWPDDIFSNDFTIVVEVLTAATTDNDYFIQQGNGSQYLASLIHSSKWAIGTTGGWVYIGNEAMQTGLYVIQYDTAETGFARWRAWLDGSTKSTATTFGSHTDIADSTADLNLGRRQTGVGFMDMVIRDFRIYSALKSHADVIADAVEDLELWWHLNDASAASTCRDYSVNGRDGTFNGTTRYEP
jgi:hypothetical protein